MSPKGNKRPKGHHDRRNSVEFAEPPKPQERPDKRSADYFRLHSTGHDGAPSSSPRPDIMRRSQHLRRFSSAVSTEKQFQDDKDHSFYGPFAHIRENLDYNYHGHYRKDRQWFQDSIVCDILYNVQETDACITPYEPWLIYTAGVQGTGKTYTIQKLVEEGKLPLLSYVHVDPQEVAYHIPEFHAYNEKCPENADNMTKKEAGYIAEITVLAALQAGRNVVLDGALRDYDWWNCFFDQCRREFPSVKVALFYIVAPRGDIICRIRKKSLETERILPETMIDDVLANLPASIEAVSPNVDYYCKISNTDKLQLLLPQEEDWESFQVNFLQTCMWKPGDKKGELGALAVTEEEQRRASLRAIQPMKPLRGRRRFSVLVSTEENHRSDKAEFYGAYSHIRKTLDYSYHSYYTRERQVFQDAIITEMLSAAILTDKDGNLCTTPTEPWLVFTAGAMGAGKSYTMNKLVVEGRFPLLAFVAVDPDIIRRSLPEFHLYVDESPELAGELTRKEAGFVAEILTLAGLQAGKNVLVDGSLRDSDWYKKYFGMLRDEFPLLRLAILHVTAPRKAVFQRAAHRALITGRVVPKETLLMALEQVPQSVKILSPLVDYFCELKNYPDSPDIEIATEGETWENFESKWQQTCAWIPPRRQFLKSSKNSNEKLSLSGVKIS